MLSSFFLWLLLFSSLFSHGVPVVLVGTKLGKSSSKSDLTICLNPMLFSLLFIVFLFLVFGMLVLSATPSTVQPKPIYTGTIFDARTIAICLCYTDRLDSLGCHFVVWKHMSSFGVELQGILYYITP